MTFDLGMPLVPEIALFALAVLVLLLGLSRANAPAVGWTAFAGLLAIFALTFASDEGVSLFGGSYVQDSLAIFAKRLFVAAAALSLLGSLTLRQRSFERRAAEYHFALLVSLLGMLVLASARELVLLFVAFELMSIPLFLLTGFLKREAVAPEAALKFFLVGTASSAVIVYGMSFIYGVTGTTALSAIPAALAEGRPLMLLGMALLLAGLGFKIAAFPFHMWAPDTYEAASTPFVAWLSVAPKAAGFIALIRLYVEGVGAAALIWMPVISVLAGMTIVTGNLMAIPQQNIKRMLAYSGVAHIGYMLVGFAALSSSGVAMMLFYLVAYMFGNMGAFLVVEAVARAEGSDGIDAYRGLAQRSPLL
ncbi:MAG: NADH-quinone oxidoreductase subunit N, partial [Acidobacteria bacterium]|nr:NADH-quinone oxidoreductase subunit N [Acidobacteriota bacterium]